MNKELRVRFAQAMNLEETILIGLNTQFANMMAAFGDMFESAQSEKLVSAFRQKVLEDLQYLMDGTLDGMISVYTEEELMALVDFYETPLGSSISKKTNEGTQAGARFGSAWGSKVVMEIALSAGLVQAEIPKVEGFKVTTVEELTQSEIAKLD